FFCSSRRRHTRFSRDWSSDLCSSDLVWFEQLSASKYYVRRQEFEGATRAVFDGLSKVLAFWKTDRFDRRGMGAVGRMLDEFDRRSEERRGGKGGRSRWRQ